MPKKGELTRQKLLECGIELMHLKGYNGTGIQQIVDAAGVPKGSFYNYFKSKDAFVLEAIREVARASADRNRELLSIPEPSPLKRLEHMLSVRIEEAAEDHARGCFLSNLCQEVAGTRPDIGDELKPILEYNKAGISECLKEAQECGELSSDYDVDDLSELIDSAAKGALMKSKAFRSVQPLQTLKRILFQTILKR